MSAGGGSPDVRAYSGYSGSWGASPHVTNVTHVVAGEPTGPAPQSGGGRRTETGDVSPHGHVIGVWGEHGEGYGHGGGEGLDGDKGESRPRIHAHGLAGTSPPQSRRRLFRQATEHTSEIRAALSPEAEDLERRMVQEGKVDEQYLTAEDLRVLWRGLWRLCGVIHPHSPGHEAWWIIVLMLIYATCFLVPYQLAFTGKAERIDGLSIAMWVLDGLYLVNMGVTFFVAYYEEGTTVLVVNRQRVARRYLRCLFWIDLVSVFPFDALSRAVDMEPTFYHVISLSRLLRMYHLAALFTWMEENLVFSYFGVVLAKLLNLLFWTAHVTGCGFFWVARVENFADETWVAQGGFVDASPTTQYVASLYWAITTLSTVGYGDIFPGTTAERIYSTIVMVFNMGVFGYVTGCFVVLVTQADAEVLKWRHAIDDARRFGKRNKIPREARVRMKHYLILKRRTHAVSTDVLDELRLPAAMQTSVLKHMLEATFVKAFCFQGCSSHFVDQVLSRAEVRSFYQGSPIVKAGEVNENLFIVHSGRAELRLPTVKDSKAFRISDFPDMAVLSSWPGLTGRAATMDRDAESRASSGGRELDGFTGPPSAEGAAHSRKGDEHVLWSSVYPESGLIHMWRAFCVRRRARRGSVKRPPPSTPAHELECPTGMSTLKHGDVFGDENIGWNTPQCWSVFATTFCRVARVSKAHLHSLESDFPGDYERMRRNIHGRCCGVVQSLEALIEDESRGRVLADLDVSRAAAMTFGSIKSTLMRAYSLRDGLPGGPADGFEHVWDHVYRQRAARNIPLHSEESESNFFATHLAQEVREAAANDEEVISDRMASLSLVCANVRRARNGLAHAIAARKRRLAAYMAEAIGVNDVEALHRMVHAEAGLDAADFARRGARVVRPPKPLTGCVSADLRRTPLHTAASVGSLAAVRCLLSFGADVNVRDAHLDTPLTLALARQGSAGRPSALIDPEFDPSLIVRELRAAGASEM